MAIDTRYPPIFNPFTEALLGVGWGDTVALIDCQFYWGNSYDGRFLQPASGILVSGKTDLALKSDDVTRPLVGALLTSAPPGGLQASLVDQPEGAATYVPYVLDETTGVQLNFSSPYGSDVQMVHVVPDGSPLRPFKDAYSFFENGYGLVSADGTGNETGGVIAEAEAFDVSGNPVWKRYYCVVNLSKLAGDLKLQQVTVSVVDGGYGQSQGQGNTYDWKVYRGGKFVGQWGAPFVDYQGETEPTPAIVNTGGTLTDHQTLTGSASWTYPVVIGAFVWPPAPGA